MQPTVKRLGVDDVQILRSAAVDVFDNEIDLVQAKRFLSDPRNILIVALDGEQVIGQLAAVVHDHVDAPADLYVDNLGVTPRWRRRGVARNLIEEAMRVGVELGAASAWVAVAEDNAPAIALYRKTGADAERIMMLNYPHHSIQQQVELE